MKDYFVLEIIKSLNKEEIKEFKLFLSSPFFNNKKYIIEFYKKIILNYPNFSEPKFSIEKIKNELKLNDNTFRAIQSKLTKLLIEYLTYKNINKSVFCKNNYKFKELLYRNLLDIFSAKSNKFEKNCFPFIKKDPFYFYDLFLYKLNKINYLLSIKEFLNNKESIKKIINNINDSYKYLYTFLLTSTISDYINCTVMYYNYDMTLDETFFKKIIDRMNIDPLLDYIKKDNELCSFYNIYLNLLDCFNDVSNENKFDLYKNTFFKNLNNLNDDEKSFHFTALINLCVIPKRTNDKELIFLRKAFELYKIIIEKKYYKDSKNIYLPIPLFRAIVNISVKLGEFKWTEEFILKNYSFVTHEQSKNMLNYGLAYLYNAKSEYEKSIEYLYKIKIDRFIYKYDIRDMYLKMLYELNDFEDVFESIHNYRDFLRTNEFSSRDIKLYRGNFIKFLEKLTYLKSSDNKNDAGYLKKLIIQAVHVSNRNWLLEKVNELIEEKSQKSLVLNKSITFKKNKIIFNI